VRSDEALAYGVQQGHTDDLRALVERYHGPLLGYLYRLTGGDGVLAEDLVQETFLRVLRSIEQYRHPRAFKPWLYAIATNLGRDHYKRLATRQTVAITEAVLNQPDQRTSAAPEAVALAHDEAIWVNAALADLPDHQREVVVLRYYQELALTEIAEALNIPVGTVKSRLSLGLQRLRSRLMEEELDHDGE
jgi:RNA polymerase sigma-70 factor (ECF subfamily)